MGKRAKRPLPHTWLKKVDGKKPQPFGRGARVDELDWRTPTSITDEALVAAAKNQHALASRIRAFREVAGLTTEEVAAQVNISPDHLRKIMRGAAHVTLTDLHLIAAAVDARVLSMVKHGREKPAP